MDQFSDERPPQILQGEGAGLEKLRGKTGDDLDAALLDSTNKVQEDERLMPQVKGISVKATWKIDEEETMPEDFQNAAGRVVITSERLLFVCDDNKRQDIAVDAACISLHAMSDDPMSVYIQIQDIQAEEMRPMELTLVPSDKSACQTLFETLSTLVSLHPVALDDDEDDDEGGMMVAPPVDEGATEEERQAMLQRLDNLLEVPPQYEVQEPQEGQFDDAEEGNDEDGAIL